MVLPGKGGHSRLMPLRLCSPWKGLGGGFLVWGVGNRATDKDQGRDKLALSFRAGVWWPPGLVLVVLLPGMKNASSNSSFFCWRFQIHRKGQRYCYVYSLRMNQDPAPRLHYCFLTAPPWSLHPLPSLISNCP